MVITTETTTGTDTGTLTSREAGEVTEDMEEDGPGSISTEGREVLREELPAVEVETRDLVVGTEAEAEGGEVLRGTNLTNRDLQTPNVAVIELNDDRHRLFHSLK